MTEDKVALTRRRVELVESLASPLLPPEERVRIQGEISVINARLKALNNTSAAQLKAAADRRKAAGMAEAQANTARARANAGLRDDDPAQTAAIDAWITTVLADSGVKVRRSRDGLDFGDVPAKWLVVLQRLRAGIHAAARGQELPEAEPEPEPPEPPKTKKR